MFQWSCRNARSYSSWRKFRTRRKELRAWAMPLGCPTTKGDIARTPGTDTFPVNLNTSGVFRGAGTLVLAARCPRRRPGGDTRRRIGGVRAVGTNDRGHPSRDSHAVRAVPARRWRRGVQRIPAPYLPGRRDVRERGSAKPGAAWRFPAIGDATAGRGGPRGARSPPPPPPRTVRPRPEQRRLRVAARPPTDERAPDPSIPLHDGRLRAPGALLARGSAHDRPRHRILRSTGGDRDSCRRREPARGPRARRVLPPPRALDSRGRGHRDVSSRESRVDAGAPWPSAARAHRTLRGPPAFHERVRRVGPRRVADARRPVRRGRRRGEPPRKHLVARTHRPRGPPALVRRERFLLPPFQVRGIRPGPARGPVVQPARRRERGRVAVHRGNAGMRSRR